jgi:catechol 2,3-dioxygenase-like lactoylglutathione lyase family enzyme
MTVQLDHVIVPVNDLDATLAFYGDVLGFGRDPDAPPFAVVRVSPTCTLQIAPWGTGGGMHLAFAMERSDFESAFARVRAHEVPYGDSFHSVGNGLGPGDEPGARGPGKALYLEDPSKHLIELRHYEA